MVDALHGGDSDDDAALLAAQPKAKAAPRHVFLDNRATASDGVRTQPKAYEAWMAARRRRQRREANTALDNELWDYLVVSGAAAAGAQGQFSRSVFLS